jgi:ketosteroid isomerase-like protein
MDSLPVTGSSPLTAEPPEVVTRLYGAFAAADAQGLASVLHPRFVGRVSAGMPLGVGGSASTPGQMLRGVWAEVFGTFEIAPVPDEFVVAGQERVIVFGFYRGRVRSSRRMVEAAFAHDIRLRDGLIVSLVQITDTAMWHKALTEAQPDGGTGTGPGDAR